MAHKKGAGSTKNGRDSNSKRLGTKCSAGQFMSAGNILIRQRSLKIQPGINVGCGRDYTLYALTNGFVKFESIKQQDKNFKKLNIVSAT